MKERDDFDDESPGGTGRSPYQSPQLIFYGKIRDLTTTGSGTDAENTGQDDKNNLKKNRP